ncbi:MAG TPA: twin-arginine translocase TatA/TatE family subunit [Thermoleophilaceae bacterium]|nr:twin-arginine translocase TatA/TatE family subunit [Thermoleophilaceae bacterium]
MPNIGPLEIIIVLVIVLIIFGPKRLPDLGRSMGKGMREFKDSVTGKSKGHEDHEELEEGSSENVDRSESKQPAAAGDRSSG